MNWVSERLSVHTETQFRFYNTTDNFNQLLLRTGLKYPINPNAILSGGYASINTYPAFESEEILVNNIKEHRFITVENENSPFF